MIKVPTSALFREGGGWALFRIEGRTAKLTPVDIGERTARDAEIRRGVSPGQRIVAHPSDRVADGVKVSAP